jgi:hypothetical protein
MRREGGFVGGGSIRSQTLQKTLTTEGTEKHREEGTERKYCYQAAGILLFDCTSPTEALGDSA